ncbi:MAG: hypothetical protein LBF02_01225 [Mycoplasmataceae bacterium]|nr:hypothetical protein [Mycoplasmataceae bacterium]
MNKNQQKYIERNFWISFPFSSSCQTNGIWNHLQTNLEHQDLKTMSFFMIANSRKEVILNLSSLEEEEKKIFLDENELVDSYFVSDLKQTETRLIYEAARECKRNELLIREFETKEKEIKKCQDFLKSPWHFPWTKWKMKDKLDVISQQKQELIQKNGLNSQNPSAECFKKMIEALNNLEEKHSQISSLKTKVLDVLTEEPSSKELMELEFEITKSKLEFAQQILLKQVCGIVIEFPKLGVIKKEDISQGKPEVLFPSLIHFIDKGTRKNGDELQMERIITKIPNNPIEEFILRTQQLEIENTRLESLEEQKEINSQTQSQHEIQIQYIKEERERYKIESLVSLEVLTNDFQEEILPICEPNSAEFLEEVIDKDIVFPTTSEIHTEISEDEPFSEESLESLDSDSSEHSFFMSEEEQLDYEPIYEPLTFESNPDDFDVSFNEVELENSENEDENREEDSLEGSFPNSQPREETSVFQQIMNLIFQR